jgi:hypothetical protein
VVPVARAADRDPAALGARDQVVSTGPDLAGLTARDRAVSTGLDRAASIDRDPTLAPAGLVVRAGRAKASTVPRPMKAQVSDSVAAAMPMARDRSSGHRDGSIDQPGRSTGPAAPMARRRASARVRDHPTIARDRVMIEPDRVTVPISRGGTIPDANPGHGSSVPAAVRRDGSSLRSSLPTARHPHPSWRKARS